MTPRDLRTVALLHLLGGVIAAIGAVMQLMTSHVNIDLGILGIPIYFGLLGLKAGWRTVALVLLWIGMLSAPVAFFLGFVSSEPVSVRVLGVQFSSASPVLLALFTAGVFLLHLWQYRVLTRATIRGLFLPPAAVLPAARS